MQLLSDVLMKVDGLNDVHLWLLHSLLLIVEVLGARISSEVRIPRPTWSRKHENLYFILGIRCAVCAARPIGPGVC